MPESAVTCSDGATGYTCTSTDTPDQADSTIACSIGVDNGNSTDYCCLPASAYSWSASTCAQDDSLTCTSPGSFGFSCAAGDNPMTYDSSLTCSAPAGDSSGDHFCCASGIVVGSSSGGFVPIAGCSPDGSVTGCASPSSGYSCTGTTSPPDQMDPTLICSIGVSSGSDLTYCCLTAVTGLGASTCAQNDSVAGCAAGSFGFKCAPGDTPDKFDSTLTCSIPVPDGPDDDFCCLSTQYSWSAGTCAPDSTIGTCTTPGSFGFKCAGTDTPDQTDPTLTGCSTGVPDADGTSTDFCCTD